MLNLPVLVFGFSVDSFEAEDEERLVADDCRMLEVVLLAEAGLVDEASSALLLATMIFLGRRVPVLLVAKL